MPKKKDAAGTTRIEISLAGIPLKQAEVHALEKAVRRSVLAELAVFDHTGHITVSPLGGDGEDAINVGGIIHTIGLILRGDEA